MANFSKRIDDTTARFGEGRFSYANILAPRGQDDGHGGVSMKYSTAFLIPKKDTESIKLFNAIVEAAKAKGIEKGTFNKGKFFGRYCPPEQWEDTMILSAYNGYPLALAEAGKALNMAAEGTQKDAAGKRLIDFFSKPRKSAADAPLFGETKIRNLPQDAPEKWQQYIEYNRQDVVAERAIRQRLMNNRPDDTEHRFWCLDAKINEAGVRIDRTLAAHAAAIGSQYTQELMQEARSITGIPNPKSPAQVKLWLKETEGINVDSLDKRVVDDVLNKLKTPEAKAFMALRKEFSKTSTTKYDVMLDATTDADPHVRGCFQFYGSHTGRFAGRLVQLQNLSKNYMPDIAAARALVRSNDYETIKVLYENVASSEDEAIAMAKQEMLYRTFQDDNWANGLLGAIKNALNVIGTGSTNGKMIGSLPVHDFGLGDIVTKYVQVPGSLIMRMIEYSPVGTIKAVADMANIFTAYNQLSRSNTLEGAKQAVADLRQQLAEAKAAGADTTELKAQLKEATSNYKDVKSRTGDIRAKAFLKDQGQYTKTKVAINNEQARMNALQAQRRAMLQLGRSLTGSGLIALFAALAKAGLLRRDDDDEDKDIRALNTSAGLSGTQLNLSALMRAASGETNWSEWLDGDKLMDIGFLEPLNGLMTIGAIVAKNNDNLISRDTMNDTLAGLMENIAELPVMQTLGTIQSSIQNLQYDAESENATQSIAKDVMSVAIDVARSSASGFIPAPVRQAAQATDEYARDMYQGDTGAEKFVDSLKGSIPGLRQTLPQKLDNFGNPRTTEADPFMRAMNAFVNPGNLRTYRSADLTNELNRLYDATGKSGILPKRYAPYSINEGPGYQLTADEKRVYQITRGQTADNLLRDLFSSQAYQTATDEQRAEWAKDVVSYADYVAKQEFLNNRNYLDEKGEGYSSRAKEEMKEALAKGVPLDTYLKYVDAIDRRYTVATYDYEARNSTLEAEYRAGNINDEQFIQLYDYTTNSSDTTPEKLTAASEAGIAPPDYLIYKAEINNNPDFNRTKANYGKNYDTANKKAVSAYIWSVAKTDEQAKILWLLRYKESTLNKLYQYKPKS